MSLPLRAVLLRTSRILAARPAFGAAAATTTRTTNLIAKATFSDSITVRCTFLPEKLGSERGVFFSQPPPLLMFLLMLLVFFF